MCIAGIWALLPQVVAKISSWSRIMGVTQREQDNSESIDSLFGCCELTKITIVNARRSALGSEDVTYSERYDR